MLTRLTVDEPEEDKASCESSEDTAQDEKTALRRRLCTVLGVSTLFREE